MGLSAVKKMPKPKRPDFPVRVRWAKDLTEALPHSARLLIKHFLEYCSHHFSYSVPLLAPSTNSSHQYFAKDNVVHSVVGHKTKDFYKLHTLMLAGRLRDWQPTGVTVAIIVFESPEHWVTKSRTIKVADCDNRVKVLFDAISKSTGQDDCVFWEVHPYKLLGKNEATHVWLFDMGDLITGHAKED